MNLVVNVKDFSFVNGDGQSFATAVAEKLSLQDAVLKDAAAPTSSTDMSVNMI